MAVYYFYWQYDKCPSKRTVYDVSANW